MEEESQVQMESHHSGAAISFRMHHRRPLLSCTYRTLVEILSHCCTTSPQLQTKVDSGHTEHRPVYEESTPTTDVEMTFTDELVPLANNKDSESKLVQETLIGESSENVGLQEEASSDKHTEGSRLDNINLTPDGKQEITPVCISSVADFLTVENQTDGCTIQIVENQNDECAIQSATEKNDANKVVDIQMENLGELEQLEVDKEFSVSDFSEILGSCFGVDMIIQSSDAIDGSHENGTVLENTFKESEHELKLKEMELEKLIYDSSAVELTSCPNTNDDIEEGEISGDLGVIESSLDALSDEVVSQKDKPTEMVHTSQVLDKEEFTNYSEDSSHMQYEMAGPSPNGKENDINICMKVENRTTTVQVQDCHLKNVVCNGNATTQNPILIGPCLENQTPVDKIIQQNASKNQISHSTEKDGDMEKKKRKKGPLSKERRAKKKKKERIKRAEKNRELGVKRLKLPPIVKQKKIVHCRHFLQGKCREGEKCNFSHDTVPLTKSKPCGHFARHTCMKGDDCPFDHDLSKYPCKNFTTDGFCSRGSDCLFSHESQKPAKQSSSATPNVLKSDCTPTQHTFPTKEGSFTASKVAKLDVNLPSSLNYLNSIKSTNELGLYGPKIDAKSLSAGNSPQLSAGSASKTAGKAPKGVTFLLNGGMPLGERSSSKQDGSSLKTSDGDNVGLKTVSSPGSANKLNEIGRAAPKTPRGINFLSFAQPPSNESTSKVFSHLLSDCNKETGKSVWKNTGERKLIGSFLESVGTVKVNRQMNQSSTYLMPGMNEIVNGAPMAMKQNINFSPFDEVLSHERKDPSRRPHTSTTITSLSFIGSGEQSTGKQNADLSSSVKSSYLPNAPSSVQKAIKSALAFAAKFEPAIKIGSSLGQEGS